MRHCLFLNVSRLKCPPVCRLIVNMGLKMCHILALRNRNIVISRPKCDGLNYLDAHSVTLMRVRRGRLVLVVKLRLRRLPHS